ncbi:hypothetical protein ACSBR2_003376 [Camellia fascicularis]
MISFGNNGMGIVANVMNNVPMEQTFSFKTNLSRENSRIGKDAKEESWLLGPSCFPKTCADDNHLSRVHTGGIGGNVMPGNMWRLDEEIVWQSTSADTSTRQQQSAGCFPTFSMLSDKIPQCLLVFSELNRRHNRYGLPLKVVSYKELYGWTMDEIVKISGLQNNCTFCGVFRHQALDCGAALLKVDKLATGHNADDIAETVLLNIL